MYLPMKYGVLYMNYLDGYDINDYLTIPDPADCTFSGTQPNTPDWYELYWNGVVQCYPGYQDPDAAGWVAQSVMAVAVDLDGNGVPDVSKFDFNRNGQDTFSSMYPDFTKSTFMAYGDFALEDANNTTIFFELQHAEKETYSINGGAQLYPWVPASHDQNIFNPDNPIGFDAGLMGAAIHYTDSFVSAADAFYAEAYNQTVAEAGFGAYYAGWFGNYPNGSYFCGHDNSGIIDWATGLMRCYAPSGALNVQPVVSVKGDRTQVITTIDQTRAVIGASGDLNIDFGSFSDFTYEISHVRTESSGYSNREGIRADRLSFGLGWDPSDPDYGLNPELDQTVGVHMFH